MPTRYVCKHCNCPIGNDWLDMAAHLVVAHGEDGFALLAGIRRVLKVPHLAPADGEAHARA